MIKSSTNDKMLFETFNEKSEFVMLLLTHDLLISAISQLGVNNLFGKEKHELINAFFIDLLQEQEINTNELLRLLQSNSNGFQSILLEQKALKKIYSTTILTLCENNKNQYVISIGLLNDSNNHPFESNMKAIINKLPGAVYWKDKEGHYLGCNNFVASMAGFTQPEEIIGKTDYDLCWREFADDWRLLDNRVIQEDTTIEREEKAKLANGKIITELTFKTPLKNQQGETIGIIGTSLDITERKQLEAALKESKDLAEVANQAKTEFLENMRHDIRTPLTGIVGFADLLKMESTNSHVKEYAENLVASSHALLSFMDEILEAIRVSSGEIPKLKKKFNLDKTLQHIIELNRSKAAEKKINLTLEYDPAIPKCVIGDKVRIHRITLELVANALNFTDKGFVKLNAVLGKQEDQKLVIKIIVEDTGIGIPKEKQQEIYVQFKRLTPSYQGIYKGAGLGLSVVKQFIDELGGEIYVESAPKKGSKFTCIIPLQAPLLDDGLGVDEAMESATDHPFEKTYAQEINPPIQNNTVLSQNRILVVEDNVVAQTVAKSIINQLQCTVDIAKNGRAAVDLWKTNTYDLIFMDIGLPDIDGYEVTHLIRVQELAQKSHVPIIALTAHAGDENKKRCIDAGMNAVLTKPLTVKACKDIIDNFIPGRKVSSPLSTTEIPEEKTDLFNLSPYPFLNIEEGIKTTGSEQMLAQMLRFMIDEALPPDFEAMKSAYQAHDWEKAQNLAHKIKGGAVYVGTVKMKMACQYFERYWKAGERELLENLYQQTVQVIEETVVQVQVWLESK